MDQRQLLFLLKAVTSAPRLKIIAYLKKHQFGSNTDLASALKLSPKTTFYHLSRLIARNVVVSIRRGGDVRYRLSMHQEQPVRRVLQML